MKITDVLALHFRLPAVREIADGTQDCLLVQVHTDGGLTGLGEVTSCSYVARAVIEAPRSARFRHGLASIAKGLDPEDTVSAAEAMAEGTSWYGPGGVVRHAMSGIDTALWDIKGKAAGKPVRSLLGACAVDAVPCYASVLWPERPEGVADSAREFLENGYGAVKYGWASMGDDPERDEALVAAARDTLGPHVALMVDAGRAWDVETTLDRIDRFRKYDLSWLEEPLGPYDVDGFRQVSAASPIPIATGEVLCLGEEFERLLGEGGVPIVQPDLGRAGGITGGQEIASMARRAGARAIPHAFGTGVLLAASAQWAAAGEQPLTEFTRSRSPLARDLVRHTMEFRDGKLHLTDAPGLGVELDPEAADRYRVT